VFDTSNAEDLIMLIMGGGMLMLMTMMMLFSSPPRRNRAYPVNASYDPYTYSRVPSARIRTPQDDYLMPISDTVTEVQGNAHIDEESRLPAPTLEFTDLSAEGIKHIKIKPKAAEPEETAEIAA
jgi:hypothetical protein